MFVVGSSERLSCTWGKCTQRRKTRSSIAASVERGSPPGRLLSLTRRTSMWARRLSSADMVARTDITTRAICFTTRRNIMAVHSNQPHDYHCQKQQGCPRPAFFSVTKCLKSLDQTSLHDCQRLTINNQGLYCRLSTAQKSQWKNLMTHENRLTPHRPPVDLPWSAMIFFNFCPFFLFSPENLALWMYGYLSKF